MPKYSLHNSNKTRYCSEIMLNQYTHILYIYVALPCEAKPLVEYFKLKKQVSVKPFAVYLSKDICLTVTGLGKSAMAAGVAYSQALFSSGKPAFLINLGIAGHRDFDLGALFLITKITDADSQRSYYPSLVFPVPCLTASIETVSKPVIDYHPTALCDMEASAFYETAIRFVSSEFVFCLKIISDNQFSEIANIQTKRVVEWIAKHLDTIEYLVLLANKQTACIKGNCDLVLYQQLINQYHFTLNEREQLKKLLDKWAVMTNNQYLESVVDLTTAKKVLQWLEIKISQVEYLL